MNATIPGPQEAPGADTYIRLSEIAEAYRVELMTRHGYSEETGNGAPDGTKSVFCGWEDRDIRFGRVEALRASVRQWLPAVEIIEAKGSATFLRW